MEIIENNSQASVEVENQSVGLEQNVPDIHIETQNNEIPVELPQRITIVGGKVKDEKNPVVQGQSSSSAKVEEK